MQTFLFTDVESSTRLWERHPEAMRIAIARQEQLLRDAIERRGGSVFNTAGDSVCAVFASADQAVAAAIAAQRALLSEPWETLAPELRIAVRMGLDTGDAHSAQGTYLGPALNQLHRLMKAGHGGQILCGATIAETSDLDPEIELRDLGRHALRDVSGEIRVFQIAASGLPDEFPPLATEQISDLSLPWHPHALFGREDELDRMRALVADPKVRLLTLLGPGGVGKTALALALLERMQRTSGMRTVFIDLSALQDAALVIPAIASAIDAVDPLLSPEDSVIARLKSLRLLLVLDNCEQVVDGVAPIVARMLPATEHIKLLATSRVPLRIRGEWEVHVEPLPLPEAGDRAGTNPAVLLFAEHARQRNDRFALDVATEPAVADICRMVDGLPLAIELAAAWVRILDPATLRDRLAQGASLLRSEERDRPDRHRTLTNTIDWSYQLLDPDAQQAFGRLAVFQGGIPLDGALAVLQADDRATFIDALDQLDSLVQANLLQPSIQTPDGPRYAMLQTIREFALGTLPADDHASASRAHAGHYAIMAATLDRAYRTTDALIWLERIDRERENMRAAVRWLSDDDPTYRQNALRMATELTEYFDIRNRHHDARDLLSRALDAAPGAPPLLRARALAQLGNMWISNYEQAETFYRRSLDTASIESADGWQMAATIGIGNIALVRGAYQRAIDIAQETLARSRESGEPAAVAQSLLIVGHTFEQAGQPARALEFLDEASRIAEKTGDIVGVAWAEKTQALAYLALSQQTRSEDLLRRAIHAFDLMGESACVTFCQIDLVRVLANDWEDAEGIVALLRQAVDDLLPMVDIFSASLALDIGALVLLRLGEPLIALELLSAAESWRASTGTVSGVSVGSEMESVRSAALNQMEPKTAERTMRRGRARSLRDALTFLQQTLAEAPAIVAQPTRSTTLGVS